MNGALMSATSRIAILAAAGLTLSFASASAADLGGNCCADLEERVAELEATTARKGNRKMSLTISGQVNKLVMYYSGTAVPGEQQVNPVSAIPGRDSGTYFGLDNITSSTRINLGGNAKVSPRLTVGFNILIDISAGGRSDSVSQFNEDDTSTTVTNDHSLRMRDANWWIEEKHLGRLTVGRLTASQSISTIDLGGVQVVANSGWGLIGGGLFVGAAGGSASTFNLWTDNAGSYGWRVDGVKYTSPTLHGFIFSATIGETNTEGNPLNLAQQRDGRTLGADLKYAGEFSGFRLAAGIGWEKGNDEYFAPANVDKTQWGGSLALLHLPTGLFLQGDYLRMDVSYLAIPDRDATKWNIQGGISKNWFGVGNTSLYAEGGRMAGFLEAHCATGLTVAPGGLPAGCGGNTYSGSDAVAKMWGLGIVQNLDAAATELYLGYRQYSFDDDSANATDPSAAGIENLRTLVGGARVKF